MACVNGQSAAGEDEVPGALTLYVTLYVGADQFGSGN
jgi:hypothetical protein